MSLASLLAPHPVGSEAPGIDPSELPAGAHPDYLYALVAAQPDPVGSPAFAMVTQHQPSSPVAVVRSSQWTVGIRRVAEHPLVRLVYGLSSAGAMGVSYSENKSIPWAIAHGFIGPAYLAYVGWNRYNGKGNANQGDADQWGDPAGAYSDQDMDLSPFEADGQEASWDGDDLEDGLGYSDFGSGFGDGLQESPNTEIADAWFDEDSQESGFRW